MHSCKRCGSYAINQNEHGRDGTDPDLCDVCYWRKRAESQTLREMQQVEKLKSPTAKRRATK